MPDVWHFGKTFLLEAIMLLRHHPLMSHKGVPSWPPVWAWVDGQEDKRPRGEIGILKAVFLSIVEPADRCFLYIDHEQSTYLGCLLFDDHAFCDQIAKLLQARCNRPIGEIGSLELPGRERVVMVLPSPLIEQAMRSKSVL
jgi:hypothetical protein